MAKPPLKEFQRENVDWIKRVKRGLLADEPGLGKSRSALAGFEGAGRVLIIAPSLVLEAGVWHDEVEQWGYDDTKYYVAPYSMLNDRKDARLPKAVAEGKPPRYRPIKRVREEWRGHWDAVILDEAHYIKGRDTKWTWAVDQISKKADSMNMLTGTPIPNWSHEVFTLLRAMNPTEAKPGGEFGSFWRWAEEWFDCTPTQHSRGFPVAGELLACTQACLRRNANDPCVHYEDFARANFGERYMRHLRKDHLDLPPIEFVDVLTPLATVARHAYTELKNNFATDIGDAEVLAWSQGAKNVMLDKMTTSPWLLNPVGEPHGGKLDQLERDLRSRNGESTLILAHYRSSVEAAHRIGQRVGARSAFIHGGTTDRANARTIRDFKAGKLDVLVGSIETLAEGLTLTVASHAIFLERSYKPSRNEQATYRIYRMGQSRACRITRYITPHSIDSGKETLLAIKTDRQMRTLSAADFVRLA